jgi:hypothetical protein
MYQKDTDLFSKLMKQNIRTVTSFIWQSLELREGDSLELREGDSLELREGDSLELREGDPSQS